MIEVWLKLTFWRCVLRQEKMRLKMAISDEIKVASIAI